MYLQKISLDLETECLLHRLAEGIWPIKLEKNNADPKGNWYRFTRNKIDQQIVLGSEG